jgi:chromosome partitioning protein
MGHTLTHKTYKAQAVATLLGTSGDSVRRYVDESGIAVLRQENGPKTRIFSVENVYELAHWRANKDSKKRVKRPVVMTIYAPKGGVGKTTLSANLASILPMFGLRTLAIDLDFQSNLTLSFGYDSELSPEEAAEAKIPLEKCVEYHFGHLFPNWPTGSLSLQQVVKKPFGEYGPHIIPSDVTLDRLDALLTYDALEGRPSDSAINKLIVEGRMKKSKTLDLSQYDVILFDAAPAKNRMTRGALLASDFVVAPISLEKFSTKAVSYLSTVLTEMQEQSNKSPELIIVGNFFDQNRTRVLNQLSTIRKNYEDSWLMSLIRRSEDFPKVLSNEDSDELPLCLSKPSSQGAADIRAVTEALIKRMGVFE